MSFQSSTRGPLRAIFILVLGAFTYWWLCLCLCLRRLEMNVDTCVWPVRDPLGIFQQDASIVQNKGER